MEASLEQTLIETTHRIVDDITKLIVERGLPSSISIHALWPDDRYTSCHLSVTDSRISEETIEDDEPVLDEARVREIVESVLQEEAERRRRNGQ